MIFLRNFHKNILTFLNTNDKMMMKEMLPKIVGTVTSHIDVIRDLVLWK